MNQNSKSIFSLLAGLSFMCFAAVLVKSSEAPGIVAVFYRMTIGGLVLLVPFLIHIYRTKQKFTFHQLKYAIAAGLCFGADMYFWATGIVASNATLPTLFANLAPVWVGFMAVIFFKEKKRPGFWIGISLAVFGVLFLGWQDLKVQQGFLTGMLLGLVAGFCYALFYMVSQVGRKLMDTISFLSVSTITSSIFLLIILLFQKYPITGYPTHSYLMFLALGIVVQVLGWFFISYAQGYLKATVIAPTLLGQPLLTAFLAVTLLNETLTLNHYIGGTIIILGIYLVHFFRLK